MNKVKEIISWYKQFDNSNIVIKSEKHTFDLNILTVNLPHLLGLHYTTYQRMRGKSLLNYIEKLDDAQIYNNIDKYNGDKLDLVKDRIKYFKYFMENLDKTLLVEQTHPTSKIKSEFLLVEDESGKILQLGIARDREDTDYFETFLVRDDSAYFKESTILEKIVSIERWEQDKLVPFSFRVEKEISPIDIIKENAMHYLSLDEDLRGNRETKIKALKLNPEVFAYFSNQDRADKELITLAIKSNPKMYHFVSEEIRNKIDHIIYYAEINPKITENVEEPYLNKSLDELNQIKLEQEKLRNLTCKIITEPTISLKKSKSGNDFHVMNFRVETSDKEKVYCSIFNNKILDYKHFKEGDYVKLFGEMMITQTEDRTFMNLKVLKASESTEKAFLGYQESKFNRSQVSAEQLKQSVLIEDIASRKYGLSPFKKSNKHLSLQEMDSIVIYQDNSFYRFSRAIGGSVIDFVMMIEECDAKQALGIVKKFFLENNIELNQVKQKNNEKIEMKLPIADKDNKHVIRYLVEDRKIDASIVKEWIKSGRLYQDVQKNCVFVGYNGEEPRYATKRSTYAAFKGDVENSVKVEGIFIDNQSKKLLVAESAIDAMSLQTMMSTVNEYDIICLGGVGAAKDTVKNYLEKKSYNTILVGLDQDEKGIEATEKIKEFVNEYYPLIEFKNLIVGEDCKDFNELLVKKIEKQLELQSQNEKEFR